MPSDPNDPLSKQNIKDRYHGVNDPVAEKILRRAKGCTLTRYMSWCVSDHEHSENGTGASELPEDKSITTLYIGGVTADITEQDIRFVVHWDQAIMQDQPASQRPLLSVWRDSHCHAGASAVVRLCRLCRVCFHD